MDIKYFATFRDLTREKSYRLTQAPASVGELLELLSVRYGPAFRKAVFDGTQLHTELILLVNGRNVRTTGGLATPLRADDDISVFPMVAGG